MSTRVMALALCAAFGVLSTTAHAGEAPPPPVVTTDCVGLAQEFMNTMTFNGQVTKAGASWAMIPNTSIGGGVSGDIDAYTVTFSAQANNSVAGTSWLAQAEFSLDGGATYLPMDPVGPNTFHSGNVAQTHTMTWCNRLQGPAGGGSAVFRIMWWKVGAGNAIADDYLVRVERSD